MNAPTQFASRERIDGVRASMIRRTTLAQRCGADPKAQAIVMRHLATSVVDFCNDWCWTYDPRLSTYGLPAYVPFDLFPRQADYLLFLEERVANRDEFVVEKSRDVGLTWLNCVFAVHKWLFAEGFKTSFGANKEANVDRIGVPDSIFEKMRLLMRHLPWWMAPQGFNSTEHDNFLRLVNPENGNTVVGEAGDNMGRGGRSTLYIVDEAAHVERAERVEAAIVAVADARGWISSVYGMGGVFARKRHSGKVPVFRFHFRDDPRKDAEWEKKKRGETDAITFASEYDIDYHASVEDICIPAKWVAASIALRDLVERDDARSYSGIAGLDVGGSGSAKSVYIERFGPWVEKPVSWRGADTTTTAHKAADIAAKNPIETLNFDSIGIGAGVSATLGNIETVTSQGVNVGDPPTQTKWPDGKRANEKFTNLKAELWYMARERFENSYFHWLHLTGDEDGVEHPVDELIIMPDDQSLTVELSLPKAERRETGKIQIERKQDLARRGAASPDYAEALMLTFAPAKPKPRVAMPPVIVDLS